ncbi:hypothetical protein QR680_011469 [Steinernema hermaphroditum]|uniref:Dual oxidase maturation factor 1 n=1 Tax=Steinernema hermaphroditum TaxID=289476 RepID=A0AA39I0C6_9BILA|nr:hypothetical protein QR680_011469 [Steinernema hermaphroditum]
MDKGWFSAFRDDFAPTRYESSPAPSSVNIKVILLFSVFIVPYVAFLIILPGLREKRLISFITMTIQLGTGAMLFGAVYLPYWNVGDAHIVSQFRAHSTERHESLLGVRVGLGSVNITMKYVRTVGDLHKKYDGLYFNERYDITGISSMASELQQAFHNGLPYPMLKVLEYFSLNQGSFDWGRHYRVAGHYTHFFSCIGLILWTLQFIFLGVIPHHYAKCGILSGVFVLIADLVYMCLCPCTLKMTFVGVDGGPVFMDMHYGYSFYGTVLAGLIMIIFNLGLSVLQYFRLYKIATFFSSTIDETVGPRCSWGRLGKSSAHSVSSGESCAVSTYISEEIVSGKNLEPRTREPTETTVAASTDIESTPERKHSRTSSIRSFESVSSLGTPSSLERAPSQFTLDDHVEHERPESPRISRSQFRIHM